jgi:hypothetical protein
VVVVSGFLLTACSSDSSSKATDEPGQTTTAAGAGETTTIAGSPATEPAPADTIGAPSDTPTDGPNALAQAKVQAALDTLPADWLGTIASDLGAEGDEGDDIVFSGCLGPDDYNLDNLDADSTASWELDAEGPAAGSPFGGPQATVEARVFAAEATATDAYAVLEKILGTDDGRNCLASEAPGQLAVDAPAGTTFEARVEGTTVEGADVGVRLIVTFNTEGLIGEIYVDLVAARFGPTCTVFATFISFAAPVDQTIASAMFTAALAAE